MESALGYLAVCVPYRNRPEHLDAFIPAVTEYLSSIHHHVFVIEQADEKPFNRGKLLNAGFLLLPDAFTHFVIHDVDMLPRSVPYCMDADIHHVAGSVEQFDYGVPYPEYFGGVAVFPRHAFAVVDGFDNEFWGWGAEDDDLLDRVNAHGLRVIRNNGVFASLQHARPNNDDYERNVERLESNRAAGKPRSGLSGCRFSVKRTVELQPGVTMISVSL